MSLFRNTLLTICLGLLAVTISHAGDNSIHVSNAHITLPPPVMKLTAGYLEISNHGHHPITLIGASSPVAEKIEIHRSTTTDGMMKMKEIKRIKIAPHETAKLSPNSRHLMLKGLTEKLHAGEIIPITLVFTGQQTITVDAEVRDVRAGKAKEQHSHHHH